MKDRVRDQPRGKPLKSGLDRAALERLALAYVGRYATTRKKLSDYLMRKIRERGWEGEGEPPVEPIVTQMVERRYIDDQAFAQMKSEGLTRRGYGPGRVRLALRLAGISDEDGHDAMTASDASAMDAALAFARRKRLGPFSTHAHDPALQQKALAAMCRAGHGFEIARQILSQNADFFQDEC